jgi:hypothetical protein
MKILLEVAPLEKAKHAKSDFTELIQFLFAYPHAGINGCQHFNTDTMKVNIVTNTK